MECGALQDIQLHRPNSHSSPVSHVQFCLNTVPATYAMELRDMTDFDGKDYINQK